jgi:hypothetical protein
MLMLWAPKMSDLPQVGRFAGVPVLGSIAHFLKYLFKFPRGILTAADMASAPIAVAHALGRVGCFLAGCCFGGTTAGPLGVHFPNGSAAFRLHRKESYADIVAQHKELGEWVSLGVHPTQLYEAGANFLIFLFLWFWVRKRKRFPGHVFACLLTAYGLSRFCLEFFRADARGEWLGLSTSQLIALPLIVAGVGMLVWGLRRATGIIDAGLAPPPGTAFIDTLHQPVEVEWDGKLVSPVEGWKAAVGRIDRKIRGAAGEPPAQGEASD